MKSIFYFLIFNSVSVLCYSQSSEWDLQRCIEYAQKNNLSLKQTQISTMINKNNTIQSKAAILPTLNAGAAHTYNFGRTIDRYTNTFANAQVLSQNFFISSNVVLWSGLAQYNTIKANEFNYLASTETYLQQVNDLGLNVATAYINVIFSEEILQISKAQRLISEEQLVRTQRLADAGTLAKSAVYDIKAQLANDEVSVTTADNNFQLAMLGLKQLLNCDTVNNFAIARPTIDDLKNDLITSSVQTIYETALKNQHMIKSANYSLLAAEKTLSAAKGRVSPTLSATGSLGTGTSALDKNIDGVDIVGIEQAPFVTQSGELIYSPKTQIRTSKKSFSDQFNDNVNKSFGFTLSVPLYNGLQTITGIKNAKLNTLSAKYAQDLTEQNLYKTIAQAYANAKAGLNKYNANISAVEASEQSFMFAQQKMNVGAISVFEFNTAKTRLQNAQSNLVQAKYDYVFKLKVLDFYQGKELKF